MRWARLKLGLQALSTPFNPLTVILERGSHPAAASAATRAAAGRAVAAAAEAAAALQEAVRVKVAHAEP